MAILASCLPVPLQPECSPDGAPHNPGQAWVATSPAPDSIAFHPGYLLTPELAELHILSPELPGTPLDVPGTPPAKAIKQQRPPSPLTIDSFVLY